ncbi:MAG TPA: phosphoesterase, partial [Paraburkholderia sp.]
EAVAGCVVGALTALVFVRYWWDAQPAQVSAVAVTLSLAAITIALHSVHVPTHRWITHLALTVSGHGHPYVRARWKAAHHLRHEATTSQTRDALTIPFPRRT